MSTNGKHDAMKDEFVSTREQLAESESKIVELNKKIGVQEDVLDKMWKTLEEKMPMNVDEIQSQRILRIMRETLGRVKEFERVKQPPQKILVKSQTPIRPVEAKK